MYQYTPNVPMNKQNKRKPVEWIVAITSISLATFILGTLVGYHVGSTNTSTNNSTQAGSSTATNSIDGGYLAISPIGVEYIQITKNADPGTNSMYKLHLTFYNTIIEYYCCGCLVAYGESGYSTIGNLQGNTLIYDGSSKSEAVFDGNTLTKNEVDARGTVYSVGYHRATVDKYNNAASALEARCK